MQSYDDLVGLARICADNARLAGTSIVARELWKMANEYRAKAMALDSGTPIDVGQPPKL
jgi:hypothetical protein